MKKTILTVLCCFISLSARADVNHYFSTIKQDPNALDAFLKAMPKGGELHYHLAGGAYPEVMLGLAATKPYCLNTATYSVTSGKNCTATGLATNDALYERYLQAWSLKNFIATTENNAEDHFFAAFYKFNPIVSDHSAELLANVLKRADSQHEQYMEIQVTPDNARSASFATLLKDKKTNAEKLSTLQKSKAFNDNVQRTATNGRNILTQAHALLGCDKNPQALGCGVTVRFQYYILRQLPPDAVFAMAVNAFAVTEASPDFVGINLVQQEDVPAALKPYKQQMQMLDFLHQHYSTVHISLHAGELSPTSVAPEDLQFHIHDAITVGHAERIGHGVDIAYEDNAEALVKMMAQQNIAVEVNLTSNDWLLNVKGAAHPLHYYLHHQVPVVLSTDDEGILRTDLTREYARGVMEQNLDYPQLKRITRNTIKYSFLPPDEKARLQQQLDEKLKQFEAKYVG
ncbi:MAG: add [Gammaproteobacteria bacterium]|jgi:adenosine deaminase|nr:add [Gammaproteobacteria bacterium]